MNDKIFLSPKVSIFSDTENRIKDSISGIEYDSYLKVDGRIITLTPLMDNILSKFKTPQEKKSIIETIIKDFNLPNDRNLSESILGFIKKMLNIGVLVVFPLVDKETTEFNLKKGFVIDEYIINQLVAKTKKSVLYLCQKIMNKEHYILKFFLDTKSDKYYYREYNQMKKISSHINIRGLINFGKHKGINYLVLEYVEGKSILKQAKKSSLKEKINLCNQLLCSIQHIHSFGVLHGDIHSSNFLVTSCNKLKLIDLGMSYNVNDNNNFHGGVPHYMPPERVYEHTIKFSSKKGNIKSEIFQLGILMYQIIYSQNPFKGTLWKELARSIINDLPTYEKKTTSGELIPDSMMTLISRALKKQPEDRFKSVEEMKKELNKIIL